MLSPLPQVHASAYVPATDSTVLQRVPVAKQLRSLQPLRDRLASDPEDLHAALALARAYLDIGRREGDPRFISYAQSSLAHWAERSDAPADALVMTAIALQSVHRFDESLAMLDRAVQRDPGNAQAWLTRASVLQVRGRFADARQSCAHLITTADQTLALACIASCNSLSGKLAESYAVLAPIAADSSGASSEVRSWLKGELAEMSVRLGDESRAETFFRESMQANPDDMVVRAEFADLLLRQRRWQETIDLLAGRESQDTLLLRLAIAGRALHSAQGDRWREMYLERYHAAMREGQATHLREHARFELEVMGDASAALQLAIRNWQVQREPADVRIYWQAAQAADPQASAALIAWIEKNHYQDALVQPRSSPLARNIQ